MAEIYSKSILAIFLATILMVQSVSMVPINAEEIEIEVEAVSNNPDPSGWYTIVNGNLHTDTYDLYPYETGASVKIGFSRFGEMINSQNNIRVGLEYRHNDAFAPPSGSSFPSTIPPSSWLQGWLINITYNNPSAGIRNVWASAQHADIIDLGKNWLRVDDDYQDQVGATVSASGRMGSNSATVGNDAERLEDPTDKGCLIDINNPGRIDCNQVHNGGRKTNGTALSGPIEVLYDGPRRYVAVTHTTVYDILAADNLPTTKIVVGDPKPLVDVVFTIDFNKVTKEVNILKDIKIAEQAKFSIGPLGISVPQINYYRDLDGQYNTTDISYHTRSVEGLIVSFSNRGEFDLRSTDTTDYKSFVHFYTYAASHINDTNNAILPTEYTNDYTLLRTLPPLTTLFTDPLSAWGLEPASASLGVDGKSFGTFDLAQVISKTSTGGLGDTVAWAAFWPSLSDWDADGGRTGYWWQSLEKDDPHRISTSDEPFRSPYIIGEWDFLLTTEPYYDSVTQLEGDIMFRGVSMYGIVDRHDEIVYADYIDDFPIFTCDDVGYWIEENEEGNGEGNGEDVFILAGNVAYGKGSDSNAPSSLGNIIDPEVAYYLKMKFCPWDLNNAADKESQRHLIVYTASGSVSSISLGVDAGDLYGMTDIDGDDIVGYNTTEAEEWRTYSTFAERVIFYDIETNTATLLVRGSDYIIDLTPERIIFTSLSLTPGDRIEIYFSVWNGSYEWIAVGRDSHVVDSAAASMVSAGFIDILGIHTLWAALDMKDTSHLTPQFLMAKFGTGTTRGDYHYDHPTDHRSALKKYWSTTIPISTSNIIGVGGPGANLVTEYFNEFMPAIYRGNFFNVADLLLVPSWDALGNGNEKPVRLSGQNVVTNTDQSKYNITDNTAPRIIPVNMQDYGWAVISTYKDINGTVGFTIWGATGNDSFWAAQAFQNGLLWNEWYKKSPVDVYKTIALDRDENGPSSNDSPFTYIHSSLADALRWEPVGVNTIIVWIDYSYISPDGGYHPRLTIVEELGTISETPQHDP